MRRDLIMMYLRRWRHVCRKSPGNSARTLIIVAIFATARGRRFTWSTS